MVSDNSARRFVGLLTLLLEEDTALGYHDGHVSINKAFAVIVRQGDCHIRILDADVQRNSEDAAGWLYYS